MIFAVACLSTLVLTCCRMDDPGVSHSVILPDPKIVSFDIERRRPLADAPRTCLAWQTLPRYLLMIRRDAWSL